VGSTLKKISWKKVCESVKSVGEWQQIRTKANYVQKYWVD